jgi:hypothetical protein
MNIKKILLLSLFFFTCTTHLNASEREKNLIFLKEEFKKAKQTRDESERNLHKIEACIPYLTTTAATTDEELTKISKDFTKIPEGKIYWYHNTKSLCLKNIMEKYELNDVPNIRQALQDKVAYTFYDLCYADSTEKIEIREKVNIEMTALIDRVAPTYK